MKMFKLHFHHFLTLLFTLGLLALLAQPAGAHTAGKLQLSAIAAGAYQVSVWTSPDPAGVGEVHVALSVVLAEDASPVLDAAVMVQMTALEDGSSLSGSATTEDSENKFLYEAVLEPEFPGPYLTAIEITGSDGQTGAVSFELEVVDESSFNPLLLIPIALGLAALILVIVSRRRKAAPAEEKNP